MNLRHPAQQTGAYPVELTGRRIRSDQEGCLLYSQLIYCLKKFHAKPMSQQIAPLPTSSMIACRPSLSLLRNVHFLPLVHQDWRENSETLVLPVHLPDTRVVHFELVHSMDIDDFIMCFRRFKNLLRKVVQLRCDSGTNFVGGEKELR